MADSAENTDEGGAGATEYSINAVHLLRTLQMVTLTLSQMADQKASMLMGASFVVFSLAVGRALTGEVPWPLAVLALFAFLSALFAAIAVMPSIAKPKARTGGPLNKLFFGHFHDLDEEEWTRSILAAIRTDEGTYRLMLHDAYQNGQVLQHTKYRYLRLAYRLFVLGLVATLATFAVQFAIYL